jgi:hypothetical protein
MFIKQTTRGDVWFNILHNHLKSPSEIFQMIITDNYKSNITATRQGYLYETIIELLIIAKCIPIIDYTEFLSGRIHNIQPLSNICKISNRKINVGNNTCDVIIKQKDDYILFSIKYKSWKQKNGKDGFDPNDTDVGKMDSEARSSVKSSYKLALFVKNKKYVENHTYKNKKDGNKKEHKLIQKNKLLFDLNDVINGIQVFCERFSTIKTKKEFVSLINTKYLNSPRKQLVPYLHHKLTLLKFIRNLQYEQHLISQKMRSGKSIEFLMISKYMMENHNYKKILIMTSVPSTINDFTNTLDTFIDFQDIEYTHWKQTNYPPVDFQGIMFCSTQYLKVGNTIEKTEWLKNLCVDMIIIDESHDGSSTITTKNILDIAQTTKKIIFVSGTSKKTEYFYTIPETCIYKWELIDEAWMKKLQTDFQMSFLDDMIKRHGELFRDCWNNPTLNKDYSKCPTQVLMKHVLPQELINKFQTYNQKHATNFGYSCSSILSLKKTNKDKFHEEFEICTHPEGKDILIHFLQSIINDCNDRQTLMKQIEILQSTKDSRGTDKRHPLLFLVYLPTHTRNNTILQLQRTLVKFLEENELWTNYQIEYSNSYENSGSEYQKYNDFILEIMKRTKENGKVGCILLLGDQGGTGVTYNDCDVTISLDDGHNLDNDLQKKARAMTEAKDKTIGINVDMNIQRTYSFLFNLLQQYRRITNTTKSNAEILYYLYEQNIFLFDPQKIGKWFGKNKILEIQSFFENVSQDIMNEIDDIYLLNSIITDDSLRQFIKTSFKQLQFLLSIPTHLEGEQQDCPKGEKLTVQYDDNMNENDFDILINETFELCKSFMFPLLALISRSYDIYDFKDIFKNPFTKNIMYRVLVDKKININEKTYPYLINIMNDILDNNEEIVNNIREIYRIASPQNLRTLIEKHFIPSSTEKKHHAEIPTPVSLVNQMLDKIPSEFWTTPHTVFEPCCGKGNFVLGIFDKFFDGLEKYESNKVKRCRLIIEECLYFGDLTTLNVFITTEILKCHIQHKCGKELNLKFNSNIGNTLKLNVKDKWGIDKFDAVIGNPPYNSCGNTGTGNTIWQYFVKVAFNYWIIDDGYLLFVHPPGWRKPNTDKGKFTDLFDLMTKTNQMLYLEIHGIKDGQKMFKCGTRYDWYLIHRVKKYKKTIIIDEEQNQLELDLTKWRWLPNSNMMEIQNIMIEHSTDSKCPIIQSMSAYEPRKKWMSSVKTDDYKYPCIHSTPKKGVRYMYSKVNDKGHFGIPKIIFGDSGINNPIIDMDGKYGMTHHAMGIQISNIQEGKHICKALQNKKFLKLVNSSLFSSYAIDWNIFKEFKKDFWKEFV